MKVMHARVKQRSEAWVEMHAFEMVVHAFRTEMHALGEVVHSLVWWRVGFAKEIYAELCERKEEEA